jgi:hypothetical protein
MSVQTLPRFVWIVPTILLCFALARLPYGYYALLRIVVCVAAGFLAWSEYQQIRRLSGWGVALALAAVIFNPIIPVYLTRGVWAYIDLAVAVLLMVHMFAARRA